MTHHLVLRDGQPLHISEAELESHLESAFKSAVWQALRTLGLSPESPGLGLDVSGEVADGYITVRTTLSDGRAASASAPIWPTATKAN